MYIYIYICICISISIYIYIYDYIASYPQDRVWLGQNQSLFGHLCEHLYKHLHEQLHEQVYETPPPARSGAPALSAAFDARE